jgi:hypothetical protein
MSATGLSDMIRNLSRQLAESLRDGSGLVSDGRITEHNINEAIGWLQSARRFLDPADPLSQQERTDGRLT